ncbi:MAG TPA: phosphate ABC transporter substrate-binding protein PstS [Usitatibacter sp.]|jgi:phosphate transport system substrate-binding protein|nr:phosphate ABC transporter substrate-binding protein PstS [Usitatibacter sp.]
MLIMRILAPALAAAAFSTCALADITGAGATFPYPIYAKWADAYKKQTGTGMNYQSIGSGGGIKQITAKTVDFGASDMPMKGEDLEKNGLVQFPAIMGGVVPVVKVAGVNAGRMKFTGALLADIYLGKVKKWNDPAIAKVNPGLKLPDQEITVVYRSDGSGTTFLWTNYLSKVSADFKSTVGEGTSVKFPAGVGGKGNEGVASYVQKLDGAIGYVEYAYAKQNKLAHGQVQNKSGKFVEPDDENFKAAAANADWKSVPGMGVVLTDQAGDKAWPITGASFILLQAKQEKPEAGREVLKFFSWAYKNGGKMAEELDYVPMPDPVVKQIEASWKSVTDASGKALR